MKRYPGSGLNPAPTIAALLLVSAVSCGRATPVTVSVSVPQAEPTETKAAELSSTATSSSNAPETASPETSVPPGTFADFRMFAGEIDRALRDGDASFFGRRVTTQTWNCLGDEIVGVCRGQPSGISLEGLPLSEKWEIYTVLIPAEYEETWRVHPDSGAPPELHSIAHRFGDTPLMPLAAEAFLAIVAPQSANGMSSAIDVRVLFFEYRDASWWLEGELQPKDEAQRWLSGDCAECYDDWSVWAD